MVSWPITSEMFSTLASCSHDPVSINSILSSFSFNKLVWIQIQISFMQSCRLVVHHSLSPFIDGLKEINLLIISIAMEIDVVFLTYVSNGWDVYNVKKIGPKTLPYEMPCFSVFLSDFSPSASRFPITKDWQQSSREIPWSSSMHCQWYWICT